MRAGPLSLTFVSSGHHSYCNCNILNCVGPQVGPLDLVGFMIEGPTSELVLNKDLQYNSNKERVVYDLFEKDSVTSL